MSDGGNMVIIEGDDQTKEFLRRGNSFVDDWLYEIVDATVFHASDRLKVHAPGHIDQLVEEHLAHAIEVGAIDGAAGVIPDITVSTFHSGLGSDPADYPVFVDVGTGIFGEFGKRIETIPGHLMGPINWTTVYADQIFVPWILGQKAQHYSDAAFADTVEWLTTHVELAVKALGRKA